MTGLPHDAHDEHDAPTYETSITVRHDGRVVASADVTTSDAAHGTAKVALGTPDRDAPSGSRGELVDQVLDHRGVRNSDSVHVVAPLGDSAAMSRLQERTTNVTARAAGASSIIDADVPQPDPEG